MLRLWLFGTPRLTDADGHEINLKGRSYLYLLAFLWLNHGQAMTRERIAGLIWPESTEKQARRNLRQALHHLRRALIPPGDDDQAVIQINVQTVQFIDDAPLWVDAAAFKRRIRDVEGQKGAARLRILEAALDLYRVPFLDGCYEDWCLRERDNLRELHRHVLDELSRLHIARREWVRAAERLKQLIQEDPLRETAHRRLMRCHYALHQRPAALSHFESYRERLREELGTDPDLQTQELYRQIRDDRLPHEAGGTGLDHSSVREVVEDPFEPEKFKSTRVAVLPFASSAGDEEAEALADGMTDELIDRLSHAEGLGVIARASMMRYKGTPRRIAEVGQEVKAGTVLEGSVRTSGDRLRISVRLVDVLTEASLWSEQYDRSLADIFAVQTDVAEAVATALRGELQDSQLRNRRGQTDDLDAYVHYLKGRNHLDKRTGESLQAGLVCFHKALEIDPSYAKAYAGMSAAHYALGTYQHRPIREELAHAREAAVKALELDADLAEALALLAAIEWHKDWDWTHVEDRLIRAILLNPSETVAYFVLCPYLSGLGRFDEAIQRAKQAQWIDPLSPAINMYLGIWHFLARRPDQGIAECLRMLEATPSFGIQWALGLNYLGKGQLADAVSTMQQANERAPGPFPPLVASLGHAYGMARETSRAEAIRDELAAMPHAPPYGLALVHVGLGKIDEAFEGLERACEQRDNWMTFLNVDPRLDGLRDDLRFQRLLEQVGLTQVDLSRESGAVQSNKDLNEAGSGGTWIRDFPR